MTTLRNERKKKKERNKDWRRSPGSPHGVIKILHLLVRGRQNMPSVPLGHRMGRGSQCCRGGACESGFGGCAEVSMVTGGIL
jgi:hypothetical protein